MRSPVNWITSYSHHCRHSPRAGLYYDGGKGGGIYVPKSSSIFPIFGKVSNNLTYLLFIVRPIILLASEQG